MEKDRQWAREILELLVRLTENHNFPCSSILSSIQKILRRTFEETMERAQPHGIETRDELD